MIQRSDSKIIFFVVLKVTLTGILLHLFHNLLTFHQDKVYKIPQSGIWSFNYKNCNFIILRPDFISLATNSFRTMIRREDKSYSIFSFENINRINIKNANKIKMKVLRAIVSPKTTTVIIDLKGLAFMDTYAATVLVTLRKFAWKKKKKFLLKNLSPEFKEIIDLLKLEKDFKIIDD
jgi:anti-anti-sigma factor